MDRIPRIIAGLGNPGRRYRDNRHNIGFRVVEELARRLGLSWDEAGDWAVAGGETASGPVRLVEPRTYMNRSGGALAAWAARAGLGLDGAPPPAPDPETGETAAPSAGLRPLVVCDDLNLPLGSVRLRVRGGSGGQNGLASVIEELGGEEFPRLRLGVAPADRPVAPGDWADFVLEDFDPDEREAVVELIDHAASALETYLEEGFEAAVSRFNRRVRPETPGDG